MSMASKSINRMIVATGGTGGHIFPALSVAREVRERYQDCDVLFMGGAGPEGDLARKDGLKFTQLPAQGVLGRGAKALTAPIWIIKGLIKARKVIREFRPDVVVGFGGYASFCPLLAARIMGVPTALHEQNSVPGKANRILGRLARKIFLSFKDNGGAFNAAKTVLTGNPVRSDIVRVGIDRVSRSGANRLLVLGGSQGARALNMAMIDALPKLMKAGVEIVHQTGPTDLETVRKGYTKAGIPEDCANGFIEDMAGAYAWADLILCRSGASTVFEVAASGLPAIFVPYPFATHDHQRMNALALVNTGAALMIDQNELNGNSLAATVTELLGNENKTSEMGKAALIAARPDAAARIVDEIESMLARTA